MTDAVPHSLVKALRSVPDFASLDERTLLRIVGASTNLFWPEGSMVFEKGSNSEALYVTLSGEIAVYDVAGGKEVEVSRIGPGDSFGELSLLLQTTHSLNARATSDSELMVVPKQSFHELLDQNPDLAEHFRRRIEERLPVRGEVPG